MANISENLSTVKQSLIDIKNAIIDKGVTPTGNITTYAEAINQLCLCGESQELCIENVGSSGTFSITKSDSSTTNFPNLELKLNNGEWFTYGFSVGGTTAITINTGDKLYLRGNNPNGFSNSITNSFTINCTFNYNISGYLTSLISTTDFNTITDIPNYCFLQLFNQQTTLLNAKDLITDNIINVGEEGFENCFYKCSNLEMAPSFENVTTIGSYGFSGCFYNCTSLTTAPSFENVTTVGGSGFRFCFYGCTKLQVIYAPNIATWHENIFEYWVIRVATTGVVFKSATLEIPTGNNGIPENWTTLIKI